MTTSTSSTASKDERTKPHGLPPALVTVVTAVLTLSAAMIGLRLQVGGVAVIWPASGVAAGLLLASSPLTRIPVGLGFAVGLFAAYLLDGRDVVSSSAFVAANVAEVFGLTLLLERLVRRPFDLGRPERMLAFVAATVGVTALAGLFAGLGLSFSGETGGGVLGTAMRYAAANGVGILAFAPAALAAKPLLSGRIDADPGDLALGAGAAALAIVVVASGAPRTELAWILAAAMLTPLASWTLLKPGPGRAASALLVLAGVTVWQTTGNAGLFTGAPVAAQSFLAGTAILLLSFGSLGRMPGTVGLGRRLAPLLRPVAIVLIVPTMLFTAVAWWSWQVTTDEARARAASTAASIAANAQRVLEVQEAMLFAALGRVEGRTPGEIQADASVQTFLVTLQSRSPTAASLSLVRADTGALVASSRPVPQAPVDVSDREYVRAHKAGAPLLHVGTVIRGRTTGETGFTMSRLDPSSGLIAVTRVPLDAFSATFEAARAGAGDSVKLVRTDGAVLAADPPQADPVGKQLAAGSVALRLVEGTLERPAIETSGDHGSRLIDVARVGGYPVVVVNDLDRRAIFTDWLTRLMPFAGLALGSMTALYVMTVRLGEAAEQAARARHEAEAQRVVAAIAERLDLAIRAARAGAWDWKVGAPASHWSAETFELLGVAPTENPPSIDRFIDDVVVVDDRPAVRAALRELLAGDERAFRIEFRIAHPHRGIRWMTAPGHVERDGDGRPLALVGLVLDTTAERAASEALKRDEERWRLLFEGSPNPMWIYERDSLKFLAVNAAAMARYGYSREEFLSMRVTDIRPVEEVPRLMRAMRSMLPYKASAGSWLHMARGGETIHAEVTAQPMEFEDRSAVAVVIHDVTDRRRAEDALRESEVRFRTMANDAPMIVWTAGPDGACDFMANGWYATTGQGEGEGLGFGRFAAVHPDDRARVEAKLRDSAARGEGFTVEYRLAHTTDGWRWVLDAAAAREGLDGTFVGFIGSILDIEHRKQSEERIRTLLREVNHRSKNLLAVVQAIARTTAAGDTASFVANFSERVQALAASQDLLVENLWRGVNAADLVRVQLGHYRDLIGRRIIVSGPPIRLSDQAAQSIGMALHELGTNAGKYGALSNDKGTVHISWNLDEGGGDKARLRIDWTETGGPPVEAPVRRGFGTAVVERLIRKSLDAEVTLDFDAQGLRWTLDCPASTAIDRTSQS